MSTEALTCLALETAAGPLSCALLRGGEVLGTATAEDSSVKAEALSSLVSGLLTGVGLNTRDIDIGGTSNGPGSFTGIRVGIAFAKGLSHATGAELRLVSLSDALAWECEHPPETFRTLVKLGKDQLIYSSASASAGGARNIFGITGLEAILSNHPSQEPLLVDPRIDLPDRVHATKISTPFSVLIGRAVSAEDWVAAHEMEFLSDAV